MQNNGTNTTPTRISRRSIVLLVLAIVALIIFFWLYSTSFVDISVQNSKAGGKVTYLIFNQDGAQKKSITTSRGDIKLRLARGTYKVAVNQGEDNYLKIVNTGGFLKTTKIEARLQPERSRQFVGNNPLGCDQYLGTTLISYNCGGLYRNINIHVPATATTPTYAIRRQDTAIDGYIRGFIQYQGKNLVLIDNRDNGETSAFYSLDEVGNDLSLINGTKLTGLNPSGYYGIRDYKDGFLIYSSDFKQINYYPGIGAAAQKINLAQPSDQSLSPTDLRTTSDSIVVLYSSDAKSSSKRSEIIIAGAGGSQDIKFHDRYSTASLCGQKLCTLGSSGLSVFDTSGNHAGLESRIGRVSAILDSDKGFWAIDKLGVFNLNTATMDGLYEYTLGDYKFNYAQTTQAGYILSLTNNKENKIALYIDQGTTDSTGGIDKKVEQLQKMPQIQSLSVYGNYIFISPNLGQPTYQPSTGIFDYDQSTKNTVNAQINEKIQQLGIDTNTYKTINSQ